MFASVFHHKLRRWWHGRNTVSIFCFHSVVDDPLPVADPFWISRATFEQQLEGICAEFDVLRLETALDRLWKGKLNRPAAALTFDDGFRNSYDVALPILRRRGLPATMFLCTRPILTGDTLWFARVHRAVCLTRRESLEWRGVSQSLADPQSREAASQLWQTMIRRMEPASIEASAEELCLQLEVEDAAASDANFGMLDAATIATMAREGTFRFGAHTRSHNVLSRLSPSAQREEIVGSVTDVARLTGRSPVLFAYPGGGPADFTTHAEKTLDELGLEAAFSMIESVCTRQAPRFRLPRYVLGHRNP